MLLRGASGRAYSVVGEGLVYGFHDAICLLGPLPKPWDVRLALDLTGEATLYRFYNTETGQSTEEDPRLCPLQGWERLHSDRTADDPEIFQAFRNLSTGDIINSDPRMSEDALRSKGVPLLTFPLT
jgi:hypothetical protein